MDWSNWKIYIVLAILVAVVILILWYRCPTKDYHHLPGRPDSQKFLAPAPVLNPVNPDTFCSLSSNIFTKWGCNYDTTIYDVSNIHFRLSYTGNDNNEIFINQNIADDTNGLTIDNQGSNYYYTYEYSLSEMLPDYYTLKIESFVPNVPEATVRHCSTCTQDLTLLPTQYDQVSSIKTDNTTYHYGLQGSGLINVSWTDTSIDYPLTKEQTFYNLSIEDSSGVTVGGTSVILEYGQVSYQYDPNTIGIGTGLKAVIYTTQNPDTDPDRRICTVDSPKTLSGSFDVVAFSMPIISANPGGDYYTTDADFLVTWNVDCSSYAGPASCPSDFDYSIHINDPDSRFDLFFDQIYSGSGSICDQNQPNYCGTLSNTNGTYTFTINMLPVGTYDQTVSMFLPGVGESNEEVHDTAPFPAEVKDPSQGSTQSSRNVRSDTSSYAFGNDIICTWDAPVATGYNYTYQISIVYSNGNVVDGSTCSNLITSPFTYTVYNIDTEPTCSGQPMPVTLIEGESYYVNIITTSTIPGEWSEADHGVTSNGSFKIVTCINDSDCQSPNGEMNPLYTDSVRRGIYNLWCVYADDPSQCLIDVGTYMNPGLSDDDLAINNRDIPNSVCKNVKGINTCIRGDCPIMSIKHNKGCVAPGQFTRANWMRNNIPTIKAGQFISATPEESYENGNLFVPVIMPSKPSIDKYSDKTDIIAVPGVFEDDGDIYLYPINMKYLHPFILWSLIFGKEGKKPYSTDVSGNKPGNPPRFYNVFHIGSGTWAKTKNCHATTSDGGISCYLRFGNNDANVGTNIQARGVDHSNMTTFSTWHVVPPYDGTKVDVNSNAPKDKGFGGSTTSSQFNTPVSNGDNRQNAWYFGSDGFSSSCRLMHRDSANGIRMLVLNDIPGGNNTYWKNINQFSWSSAGDGIVPIIPGPPYSNEDRSLKITKDSFCAPVQYGAITVQKKSSSTKSQTQFYLEAYTWNDTYTKYEGLGFFRTIANDAYIDKDIVNLSFQTIWMSDGDGIYETGTKNQRLWFGVMGINMYLSYNAKSDHQANALVSSSSPNTCIIDPTGSIRTNISGTWLYLSIDTDTNKVFWMEPGYTSSNHPNYIIPMWAMTWIKAKQATTSAGP